MTSQRLPVGVSEEMNLAVAMRARTRTNLALHHLFAACRFAAQLCRVERENDGSPFGAFWEEILHNALGVATLSVACLESYANQFYADGAIGSGIPNEAATSKIADLVDREDILTKLDLILTIRSGRALDRGATVVQNVDAIIKLRNAVVHFRPEWHDEQARHAKLSRQLNHRFTGSPFLPGEPLFPRAWASGSFATWALSSTVAFLDYYCAATGLPSYLAQFKPRLHELSDGAVQPVVAPDVRQPASPPDARG